MADIPTGASGAQKSGPARTAHTTLDAIALDMARTAFASWDGYCYMRETRQHFTAEARAFWLARFRAVAAERAG